MPKKMDSPDPSIEWIDLPPRPPSNYRDAKGFVGALKTNPGQWAVYRRDSRHGKDGQYLRKEYGVEATVRGNGDGTFTVYARWPES